MKVHLQKISVPFEYPVFFTKRAFDKDNTAFIEGIARLEANRRHKLFFVVDGGVAEAWPNLSNDIEEYVNAHSDKLELIAPLEVIPGGEQVKGDPNVTTRLQRRFFELALDRQSFVVIIGGGAVLDTAGYAAAVTHRGIRQLRMPTTVLSQNDSGVGVKNGINAFGVKNFLGAFAPPFAVINDLAFIETLTDRDKIAGIAEAVKVSLIRDVDFFLWLEEHSKDLRQFTDHAMSHMIRRGGELHLEHIATSGDPFEFGMARPLDFGHWAGHKLESLSDYDLRHGEAVAIGMAIDTCYSVATGLLEQAQGERVLNLMEKIGLKLWHSSLDKTGENGQLAVLGGLEDFRQHLGGRLTITLLQGIGRGVEVHEMDEKIVLGCIEQLKQRKAG